jgi:hypothetical protein
MIRKLSRRGVLAVAAGLCLALVAGPTFAKPRGGALGEILEALDQLRAEVQAIADAVAPPSGPHRLSSGLFNIPQDAASVDWVLVNNSATDQTVTVTVYKHGGLGRSVVPPGPITFTVAPEDNFHNANSVPTTFPPGFYYEVIVETDSLAVLPSVSIWRDHGNTGIPGTLIPPGDWVRLP